MHTGTMHEDCKQVKFMLLIVRRHVVYCHVLLNPAENRCVLANEQPAIARTVVAHPFKDWCNPIL
jgi:hypothetical protein